MYDFLTADRIALTIEQHLRILESVVAGDIEAAVRGLRLNIGESMEVVESRAVHRDHPDGTPKGNPPMTDTAPQSPTEPEGFAGEPDGDDPTVSEATASARDHTPLGEPQPLLKVVGFTKHFGPVHANTDVDLHVLPGEVHALVGENGAGKSTLLKMIYGVYEPDEGRMHVDGVAVTPGDPGEARRLGIGMVFQDLRLVPAFTVAENVSAGDPRRHPAQAARAGDADHRRERPARPARRPAREGASPVHRLSASASRSSRCS